MASIIVGGLALTAAGVLGKHALNALKASGLGAIKYYKGGFEPVMSRREASLILGISPISHPDRVKIAYKKVIMANHPDKGGSPYIASKINTAKDMLLSSKQ